MEEKKFVDIVQNLGGRVFLVGGYVRDLIRGVAAKDRDYCLTGIDEEQFSANFPKATKIGKAFPVYQVLIEHEKCEVAFARREKKSGHGYKGFESYSDPSVRIEEDLYRRDSTMNAIALELPARNFIDPYRGIEDIRAGKIRAVSEHFLEDPVRALRAARQSAQFNFEITEETFELMKRCRDEVTYEPAERICQELLRAIKTDRPSIFFRSLLTANLLDVTFPELFDLVGKSQPAAFHPEGDAFEHTMKILDEVSASIKDSAIRFAAMCHDLGKGTTPKEMLPHHYQHESRGLEVLERWNQRMILPKIFMHTAKFAIREHMRVPVMQKPGKIVEFLFALEKSKISIDGFRELIRCDNHGIVPNFLQHAEEIIEELSKIRGDSAPKNVYKKQIGQWILTERIKKYLEIKKRWE